jgi:hypothetical protein
VSIVVVVVVVVVAPSYTDPLPRCVWLLLTVTYIGCASVCDQRLYAAACDTPECVRLFICGDAKQLHAALISGLPLHPLMAIDGDDASSAAPAGAGAPPAPAATAKAVERACRSLLIASSVFMSHNAQ